MATEQETGRGLHQHDGDSEPGVEVEAIGPDSYRSALDRAKRDNTFNRTPLHPRAEVVKDIKTWRVPRRKSQRY